MVRKVSRKKGLAGSDPVTMRTARLSDLRMLEGPFERVFEVSSWMGRPLSFSRDMGQIYNRANLRHCLVAFSGGKIVSHVAGRPLPMRVDGAEFSWGAYGNVMTIPEFRGRGLGSRLSKASWERLRRSGADGVFISGGHSIYMNAGASACGDYRELSLKRRNMLAAICSMRGISLRKARPGDAEAMARLHEGEWTGWRRTSREFGPVIKRGIAGVVAGSAWLVLRGNVPVAYVVIMTDRPGRRGKPVHGTLWDYSGDRMALYGALPLLARGLHLSALEVTAGAWDTTWRDCLRSTGAREKYGGFPGVMLILDPMRFFRRLRPWLKSCLGSETAGKLSLRRSGNGGFVFRLGAEDHKLTDSAALVRIIFGDKPDRWGKALPRKRSLRVALQEAFPLPFPVLGLSWI